MGKASFESIRTSSSFSQPHHHQQRVQFYDSKEHSHIEQGDPYDTSALNIDYSDDEEDSPQQEVYQRPPPPIPTPTASTSSRLNRNIPQRASRPHQQAKKQKEGKESSSVSGHNDESESNQLPVDEYGFLLQGNQVSSSSRLSTRSHLSGKSMKEYREAELKWLSIVNKLDANSIKRDAKMKKMVRSSGIPASVRARVWPFLAGSSIKAGQFQRLLNKPHIPIYDVIERDITRCYPDHSQFVDENGQGQRDLRAVLTAYAQYNNQLEYCQGMGRLAGLMLMHMAVEDSFWLLVATIDGYMNGYFTPTLSQLRIDAYIIGQLLKDHNPRLAQHLESNDITPIMYIAQWFLTAFTMTLPWESVLRVWDAFYFEGTKVFYRVSLAIMDLCKDYLLQSCPTNADILAFLLHIPHKYLQPEALLDTAFRIKLSKTDIKRYAKKAGSEDASLPFEDSIKNLGIRGNSKSQVFKGFGEKIIRKSGSSINMKEQDS
ncbi:TBC-domain-containing protein [Backusella circina FSU 941]|nr:TBC-domain-containing protein [Backusella circina FSU 941]